MRLRLPRPSSALGDETGPINEFKIKIKVTTILYKYPEVVKVLDLGRSGGDSVKSSIDDGQFAVGIEGSTFSKDRMRSVWTILDHLPRGYDIELDFPLLRAWFTCDITRPFQLFFQLSSSSCV